MVSVTGGHPSVRTTFANLKSSCVVIEERLDPDLQKGIFDSKLQQKGDFRGDLRKVPCHHEEEHIAAEQIFPLIKTGLWYTPTIKHHCPRTAVASSLRACSNKVTSDPRLFSEYTKWFRENYIPEFLECLDRENINVDLDKWLTRYPLSYRVNMRRAIDENHQTSLGNLDLNYEAFTKVEMQFTTVPHDLKETEANDTKERQICGPTNEKKVWANAFINELEGVASRQYKPYCGRHNWLQICESLEEMERNMSGRHIWGASDGSGFDMTQLIPQNRLMNELLMACAKHQNVTWCEPLNIDRFKEAIDGSLSLKVSVDRGDLKYQAQGRASGDGWTTFGNTMLMISYWKFTAFKAGLKSFGLKVKGDDVLFIILQSDRENFLRCVDQVFTKSKHQHTHGLGQICKKIDFGALTDLDFLSNEFFVTREGHYRMTRIPARVIQTNSWSTRVPKNRCTLDSRQQLCYSKGMCLRAWAEGLPIFGVLAEKMIELGHPGKLTEFNEYADADRVWHCGRDDYDAYLHYLDTAYHISRKEVFEIENKIKQVSTLHGILELPQLEKLYERHR
jgi:hypothetical protein